jgi:hypothetical protein
MNAQPILLSAFHCSSRWTVCGLLGSARWEAPRSVRRVDDSALNPRWFLVNRVRQQQNGSAEKECVEEKV